MPECLRWEKNLRLTAVLVPCNSPLLRAGPSPVGVNKWPQPSLNITPVQNRKREQEAKEYSPNQKQSEKLSEKRSFCFFFFFVFFRIQCVCLIPFWSILWPRVVLVERTAGGALSVCKLHDMAIVWVWAYMEAPMARRIQQVWSPRSGESLCAFLSSDFLLLLTALVCHYELPGCDVPPKLWSALPPCSCVQGDVLQPPPPATTGETFIVQLFKQLASDTK